MGESLSNIVHTVSSKNTQSTCSLTTYSYGNVADNSAPNSDVFTFSESAGVVTVTVNENILTVLQGTYRIHVRESDYVDAAVFVDSVIEVNLIEILDCTPQTFTLPVGLLPEYFYLKDVSGGAGTPVSITFTDAQYGDCEFTSAITYACDSCG